jgi:hypothetical protein
MRAVELHDQKGVVGEITLAGGVAVPSNALARRTIEQTKIIWPGNPPQEVKPEDGERYLKALLVNLNGTYFWAEPKP